jgi:hypothetical protein
VAAAVLLSAIAAGCTQQQPARLPAQWRATARTVGAAGDVLVGKAQPVHPQR